MFEWVRKSEILYWNEDIGFIDKLENFINVERKEAECVCRYCRQVGIIAVFVDVLF